MTWKKVFILWVLAQTLVIVFAFVHAFVTTSSEFLLYGSCEDLDTINEWLVHARCTK